MNDDRGRIVENEVKGSHKPGFYERYIKRVLDIILSGLALIVLSPMIFVTAMLVRTKLGSPVIFTQERPGLHEKIFKLYKFRTMTDERDKNGDLLPDEVRLTNFGKLLRSFSLDEMPELWNIFRGDMSIVGPRPLLVKYLPYYSEKERERHSVRPGLTGLAQIHGRNYLMWDERLDMDVKYARNVTLLGDAKIIFQTVLKVLRREGVAEKRITPLDQVRRKEGIQ